MTDTVIDVLARTASAHGGRPAMRVKRDGAWRTTSWGEYRDQAFLAARGLMRLGHEPGQAVLIMGFNRPEWFLADVGVIAARGRPAGIYTTSTPEQCRFIAEHAGAPVAVLENQEYLARFRAIRDRLPALKAIVLMEGDADDEGVYSWARLLELGREVPEGDLRRRIDAQKPDDVCTLIYTSGTTGEPKAVMLTHENLVWTAQAVIEAFGLGADDTFISYLALSHISEQMVSLHCPMGCGGTTWFAESLDRLAANLREIRPHVFFAVPRLWEKIQAAMETAGARNSPLKKKLVAWARRKGLEGGRADQRGNPRPLLYGLANKLVFSKVRQRLGFDRTRVCGSGAAALSTETQQFFLSLGIPIYNIYGLSETTAPATWNVPGAFREGTAGRPVPGTEVRLAEDGEVLIRGPQVFAGYYGNEAATREVLDPDGWFHTGDIGSFDADGFLTITDRKKELLVTSGGKNIAPAPIEAKLQRIPAVAQAVVVGDGRNYVAALLTLDPERIADEAAAAGSPARDVAAASRCPTFRAYLGKEVEQVNAELARHETIKRFTILPGELTVEGDELTPTLKLKRRVIARKHAAQIEELYH